MLQSARAVNLERAGSIFAVKKTRQSSGGSRMTNSVMERFMNKYILLLVFALGVLAGSRCFAETPENSIYVELVDKGVPLSGGDRAALPVFVMADGLDQAEQEKILKDVIAKKANGPNLQQFIANKVSAPFIQLSSDVPNSTSHQIDLYFVAYGNLQTVANGNFWKARIGAQGKNGALDFLKDKSLKQRGLAVIDQAKIKERYAFADKIDLFSMVQVSGTARSIETIGDESVVVAIQLDPKFANDKEFPNEWRSIKFNAAGAKVVGNPQPYDGLGAYAKVTKLANPAGALFVEYHIIYNEPMGWFNGKGVLDSKLSQMIQNDVKRFRNDLKTAPAGVAAGAAAPAAGGQPQQPAGPQAAAAPAGSASKK
jgi:hypothetical protein